MENLIRRIEKIASLYSLVKDLLRVQVSHEDPLVVSLTVAECLVHRFLIDPGSSANVMPKIMFDRLEIKLEKLKPIDNPLLGFDRKRVEPIGMVELSVQATERVLLESFMVIDIHLSCNHLMGRGWINRVQGVPSILHQIDLHKPDRTTRIGSGLAVGEKQQLIEFLSQNKDVLTWSHSNMPGISPSVSCHSFNVDPDTKPVRQSREDLPRSAIKS
ncbi:uncharacterized protein LOC132269304 [Cornus florida]|uniref:uncharacterized protein LOC132269304 n=1 Tax=Cornus florida TaxID=4283 RepID=UPI002897E4AF|nr:uncharacterized protein LOC132269304 [Cornus florida]